jgi:hypothetical protein
MQTLSTALDKAMNFVEATISKVAGLTKPRIKFLLWLFERWLMVPVRYNFLNLSRYDGYSEKAIRSQFSTPLPFVALFHQLFAGLYKKECLAVFDPCYISKSGKQTYGLAKYWSGTSQRVEKGLEAGCLALVDVADATAYSLEVVQTPAAAATSSSKESLMKHYSSIITQRAADIVQYTCILAVDGYFMKESFIGEVTKVGLSVITKARHDANMRYLYKGVQSKGRGRKKRYDGKLNWQCIDKRRWKRCYEDDCIRAYEAVLYSVILKQQVKVVYVQSKDRNSYELLVCTDTTMEGQTILSYYRLRFQIEFLIRDAKTYTGMEHCQARSREKLYNHFNMAMMSVSVVKYRTWATRTDKQQLPFSMRSIKTCCINKYMTQTIFTNLILDLNCKKIKQLYYKCLNIGNMAA